MAENKNTTSKLIMVMNDTKEILDLFEDLLSGEGYRVSLHSFNTRDLEAVIMVKPDLIISDHIPGFEKEGWQFIQKLKMHRETASIPIILCTTQVGTIRELEGQLAAKNITIVLKPFDIDELINAVREQIGPADDPNITKLSVEKRVQRDDENEAG